MATPFFDEIPLHRWNDTAQADRVMLVGVSGTVFTADNPLPVSATVVVPPVTMGSVPISGTVIVDSILNPIKIKETSPIDPSKNNASFIIIYDNFNIMRKLRNTISGITYERSFAYDSNNNLLSGTSWAQI